MSVIPNRKVLETSYNEVARSYCNTYNHYSISAEYEISRSGRVSSYSEFVSLESSRSLVLILLSRLSVKSCARKNRSGARYVLMSL